MLDWLFGWFFHVMPTFVGLSNAKFAKIDMISNYVLNKKNERVNNQFGLTD